MIVLSGINFRTNKLCILFICVYTIVSCSTSKTVINPKYRDNIPIVAFCDLPKFKGKQVYLKCYYSGIDEYWSLRSLDHRNCSSKLTVELEFKGYNPILVPEKYESVFKEVNENYHNSYLLIEAIGTFENDNKSGYGHLGSNNSRFIVSELIEAILVKK